MIHFTHLVILFSVAHLTYGVKQCAAPADVAFVIDSSVSIREEDFNKQIVFVEKLLDSFEIGPNKTQVAALKFSNQVVNEFHFNDHDNKGDVIKKIRGIKHAYGPATYTHDGIQGMRTELFAPGNGARPNVPHICIILTDGESTMKSKTLEQANIAKQAGIRIIAIGIGNVHEDELKDMVTPPSYTNFFYIKNFNDLQTAVFQELVGHAACPEETCTTPADVAFVIDSSVSIKKEDFTKEIDFVANLIDLFDIGTDKTQVAALTFSNKVVNEFHFNDHDNKDDIIKKVRGITHAFGRATYTHDGIEAMRKELFSPGNGARPNVPHICILLTDGESTIRKLTQVQANITKQEGITIIAIGIGNINEEELKNMVTPPSQENYFHIKNFNDLQGGLLKELVRKTACRV